jgi:hypothetical protein
VTHRAVLAIAVCLAAAGSIGCGGGGSSPAPTSPGGAPEIPAANACEAIGGSAAGRTAIVNGAACSTGNSPVVLLNLRSRFDVPAGSCSGTIIAPRAILTGAHCLDEEVGIARVWLGTGSEIVAESFRYYPGYGGVGSTPDVGIVRVKEPLRPGAVPLLTSRAARVGETAVIAGWGRDSSSVPATLRAGTALITAVGALHLETMFSTSGSSICAGDSGGPLLLSEGSAWTLAGVISAASSSGCTTGTNFYVSVRHPDVLRFVLEQVPEAGVR